MSNTTPSRTAGPVRRLARLLTTGALAAGMLIVPIAGEAAAGSPPAKVKPAPAKIMCGFCVR